MQLWKKEGGHVCRKSFTHQLQNSFCIYDADVLEKLCQ